MKIDAHYYALLAFCRACGFDKESACTIAHASQFVDDAKIWGSNLRLTVLYNIESARRTRVVFPAACGGVVHSNIYP